MRSEPLRGVAAVAPGDAVQCGPRARAVEILLQPGMRIAHEFVHCADLDAFVEEYRDPVAQHGEAVEIVGDHDHGQAERLTQLEDQAVELGGADRIEPRRRFRSEEHTSELQSLMRISYAVFCLKKKKK